MKKASLVVTAAILAAAILGGIMFQRFGRQAAGKRTTSAERIRLPSPVFDSQISIEQAMLQRRSVREYLPDSLSLAAVSQLLWAAQGITGVQGQRTAPSAGALYPLEVYLVAGRVTGLQAGVYRYLPEEHSLVLVFEGDVLQELGRAVLSQTWVREAPLVIAITGVYERTARKYGERAQRYVHIEVGAAAQNIYLQAESLGLGTVFVGAFEDAEISTILRLGQDEQPLALLPVGRPAGH